MVDIVVVTGNEIRHHYVRIRLGKTFDQLRTKNLLKLQSRNKSKRVDPHRVFPADMLNSAKQIG